MGVAIGLGRTDVLAPKNSVANGWELATARQQLLHFMAPNFVESSAQLVALDDRH